MLTRVASVSAAVSLAAVVLVVAGATAGDESTADRRIYSPDQLEWRDGPPSLPKGAEFVIVEGDPAAAGEYFALRLRMPDGYRIPPHWHPVAERVTVISGTFRLGHGETFDAGATRSLGAGSYFSLPPKSRHFAQADGETVVQLNSVGPWAINYVNAGDDPRQASTSR
jgi:quercetin dioxygenase-like cupin family protein